MVVPCHMFVERDTGPYDCFRVPPAEGEDLLIVSDEIYRDIVHDPATPVLGPAEVAAHTFGEPPAIHERLRPAAVCTGR